MDTSEQTALFLQITGINDEAVASQFLEMSGGNLDTAVSLYFEHGSSSTALPASSSTGNNNIGDGHEGDEDLANRLQNEAYQDNDQVRAPIRSTVERLVDDHPFNPSPLHSSRTRENLFATSGPVGVFNQAMGFNSRENFNDDEDEEEKEDEDDYGYRDDNEIVVDELDDDDHNHEMYSDEELVQATDSDGDVTYVRRRVMRRRPARRGRGAISQQTSHQRRLAALFSPPWDIISKYDLNTAKNVGRETKKWIVVNIQDNSEFRCQQLNRDLWSKTEVKDIIKENFLLLQYPSESMAGQEYRGYYPFSEYPHIAILDPKTGERLMMWSEVPQPRLFVEQLVDFLDRFSLEPGHVNPLVQHKTKVDPSSLSEEQQMELAIKKSLGTHVEEEDGVTMHNGDQSNPILLDSDDDGEYSEFEEISDEEGEDGSHPEIGDNKQAELATVPDSSRSDKAEPVEEKLDDLTDEEIFATILPAAHDEPENDPAQTTRIQIRSGDGSRVIRRFNKTDTVQVVYEYVKSNFESVKEGKFFTLMSQRNNLIRRVKESLEEAGLLNASILLEIDE